MRISLLTGLALLLALPLAAAGDNWNAPKTAWGEPDLRGVWDYRTITPLERPKEMAGKAVLSDEEAAEFETSLVKTKDKDRRQSDGLTLQADVANAYNEFWWH